MLSVGIYIAMVTSRFSQYKVNLHVTIARLMQLLYYNNVDSFVHS